MTVDPALHAPAYPPADLTTCDREPIHVPGAIQPHGVLLALDEDGVVVMASANVDEHLGRAATACLGLTLAELIGPAAAGPVLATLTDGQLGAPVRVEPAGSGGLSGRPVDAVLHRSAERVVVEMEPAQHGADVSAVSYRSARASMLRLSSRGSVRDLCDTLAGEIRSLTGFDRVMVYRFDARWNGEVISESRREDLNSFLGQHYPASDIPAQARRLYTANWIRLIADIAYRPVPLEPVLDPATGAPLDLSFSVLRSVSPIHLEYLTNMSVTASMSVSLVIDGALWGMVACHHYNGPHQPSQDVRSAAEFVGQAASQLIANREAADERQAAYAAQTVLTRVSTDLGTDLHAPHDALMRHPELLPLFGATGAAMHVGGEIRTVGRVPSGPVLRRIAAAMAPGERPVAVDCLSDLDPTLAEHAAVAAGALLLPNGPDRWLMWLRPEMPEIISWGGDPHNKNISAAEGPEVRLSPRKSFEKWLEVVRGRSTPWTRVEIEAAEGIRSFMSSLLVRRTREQLTIAESLQRSIVLDEAPEVPGFQVEARYQPASGNQLGGDWWDTFALPDGRTAFVVGDVSGHGVDAAAAMAQVRTAVRAHLFDGRTPADTLDTIDRLVDSMLGGRTGTAVIAVVDPATGTAEIASAGHPPPLLVDGDGARVVQVRPRPLLGVGFGQATSAHVELGDATLLLYSDGLIESRHHTLDVGIGRLRAAAVGPAGEDMATWAARLLESAEGLEDDDRTLVGVRLA